MESYEQTAHRHTSSTASLASIKGDLRPGHNILTTGDPAISFKVESRADGVYQSGMHAPSGYIRTERIDVVIGSGRIGQTYLYWKEGMLYELPVSYLAAGPGWINSPGYRDGQIDFERPVVPRCLECHSTSVQFQVSGQWLRYGEAPQLGIQCSKCHGPGEEHIARQRVDSGNVKVQAIVNPARLPRERLLDVCGLCHSGVRPSIRPPFSFLPGQDLSEYLGPSQAPPDVAPDVHGDQIGLLARSKCFRGSEQMTCTTCHSVHRTERNLEQMATKCLPCHDTDRHPASAGSGAQLLQGCIDCHMPNLVSQALQVRTSSGLAPILYRSHAIAVYR